MQAFKAGMVEQAREGTMGWTREEAERYYRAAGGEDFDSAWERRLADERAAAAAVEAGTFHTAGGMLMYVIAGRKP